MRRTPDLAIGALTLEWDEELRAMTVTARTRVGEVEVTEYEWYIQEPAQWEQVWSEAVGTLVEALAVYAGDCLEEQLVLFP